MILFFTDLYANSLDYRQIFLGLPKLKLSDILFRAPV